jgi:hypothetical protein
MAGTLAHGVRTALNDLRNGSRAAKLRSAGEKPGARPGLAADGVGADNATRGSAARSERAARASERPADSRSGAADTGSDIADRGAHAAADAADRAADGRPDTANDVTKPPTTPPR